MAQHTDVLSTLLTLQGDSAFISGMQRSGDAIGSFAKRHEVMMGNLAMIGPYANAAGDRMMGAANSWLQSAGRFEQSQVAYRGLLKDDTVGGKGDQFLKRLQTFSAETPFEFTDLTSSTQKMLAYGFTTEDILRKQGNQWKGLAVTIGNAAGMLGAGPEGIDAMTRAFGKMRATGKPSMEYLTVLAERGIPIIEILKEQLGITGEEVRNLATSGRPVQEVIDALQRGMEAKFGDGMAKQSKTFLGAMSNLADVQEQTKVALGQTLIGPAQAGARALTWLNSGIMSLPPGLQTAIGYGTVFGGGLFKIIGAAGGVSQSILAVQATMALLRGSQAAGAVANGIQAGSTAATIPPSMGAAAANYTVAGSLYAVLVPLGLVVAALATATLWWRNYKVASETGKEGKYKKETDDYTALMLKSRGQKYDKSGAIVKDEKATAESMAEAKRQMAAEKGKPTDTSWRTAGDGNWFNGNPSNGTGGSNAGAAGTSPQGNSTAQRMPNGVLRVQTDVMGGAGVNENDLRTYNAMAY